MNGLRLLMGNPYRNIVQTLRVTSRTTQLPTVHHRPPGLVTPLVNAHGTHLRNVAPVHLASEDPS